MAAAPRSAEAVVRLRCAHSLWEVQRRGAKGTVTAFSPSFEQGRESGQDKTGTAPFFRHASSLACSGDPREKPFTDHPSPGKKKAGDGRRDLCSA